jgi:hypothetical protein
MTFVTEVRGVHLDFAQCERRAGSGANGGGDPPPHNNAFTASMKRIRLIGFDT